MRRTIMGWQSFTGRGALSNPPGRFDRQKLEAVDDGWFLEESPDSIATTLEPDRARSVITTNGVRSFIALYMFAPASGPPTRLKQATDVFPVALA